MGLHPCKYMFPFLPTYLALPRTYIVRVMIDGLPAPSHLISYPHRVFFFFFFSKGCMYVHRILPYSKYRVIIFVKGFYLPKESMAL